MSPLHTGVFPCIIGELLKSLPGGLGIHGQHTPVKGDLGNHLQVIEFIRRRSIQNGDNEIREITQRISVRFGIGYIGIADDSSSSRSVVHHKGPAKVLFQIGSPDPGREGCYASRGKGDHDGYRTARVFLGCPSSV